MITILCVMKHELQLLAVHMETIITITQNHHFFPFCHNHTKLHLFTNTTIKTFTISRSHGTLSF